MLLCLHRMRTFARMHVSCQAMNIPLATDAAALLLGHGLESVLPLLFAYLVWDAQAKLIVACTYLARWATRAVTMLRLQCNSWGHLVDAVVPYGVAVHKQQGMAAGVLAGT